MQPFFDNEREYFMSLARHKRVKRGSSGPLRYRSDARITKALRDLKLMKTEQQIPVGEQEAYAVFSMEMKILHRPELPVHYDVVERATQLRWQFRNVHNWKSQFFRSLKDAVDLDARPSAGEAKHFAEILEILLRHNILEKIAKHEAALGEQLRKSDQDLRDLADWRIVNGLKRGDIGYQVSHRLDWDKVIHHDVLPPEAG